MNVTGKKKGISKMKIASEKFLRFAGGIALLLATGGCATTEVERLEKAIIEKDYMADEEIARLRSLAHPGWTDGSKPDNASPDAVAAYDRVVDAENFRERHFGGHCLRNFMGCFHMLMDTDFISPQRGDYSMLMLGIGDMFGYCGKTNDMIFCYGIVASNGLWLAQERLYNLYLNAASPCFSLENAVPWLDMAAKNNDGYAAEKLAALYESNAIPGGNSKLAGSLYDMAALSYVKQWKDMELERLSHGYETPEEEDGITPENCSIHIIVSANGFDYRKIPFSKSIGYDDVYENTAEKCNEHESITYCFERAIALGCLEAEAHLKKYKEDLVYFRENNTFPELCKKNGNKSDDGN